MDEDLNRRCCELQQEVETLRGLNAELEVRARERMQALELFSYSIAHELRAPLRAINGFASAVLEDHSAELEDDAKLALTRVIKSGVRMGALIDALLSLWRVTRATMRREKLNLAAMAEVIVAELRRLDPDHEVEIRMFGPLTARGDPQLVRVLLQHLLENAWKFSRHAVRPRIELASDGDTFLVRDNGVGFDMQYAKTLFAPFQRLHLARDFPGTGIGLAIAAHICRRHEGNIAVTAAPNEGATFSFTLSGHGDSNA